ncbi:hypothetical protein SAMN05216229_102119 [Geopseudomonas sagittaria]|uniref:Uncharacterized protein n=1 Tax=Geopseudomonas sagittaria TaxID=1135990 RepID=A0A1I5PZR4_9GAMM|nr:hypothetical protein [Pseudomonas sagittaria]SFP39462.1 hypothetical protein SAMN05216229_102119 [Pseudomonas sagittaria]
MTRDELVREFRIATQDRVDPYRWPTDWLEGWLKEAEAEACVRARLLHESENEDVCEVDVYAGEGSFPLHPALYEIDHIAYRQAGETCRRPIRLVSQEWLDDNLRDWRDRAGRPEYAIQGDTTIRLIPKPDADGVLLLEGYRTPLERTGEWRPEIHRAHHLQLLQWLLFRAYSVPDADLADPQRAAMAEGTFTDYFGARSDSDLRRITREDADHHNKAWV